MAIFTNFAATLARQPSAASLAPRLKKSNFYVIGSLGWSTLKASVIRPLLSKPVIKKISKRIKAESF